MDGCGGSTRSLPSEERMVVIARGRKADSGSSEFAIMLHDNSTFADELGLLIFKQKRLRASWLVCL